MRFSVLVVGGLGHVGSAVLSELSSLPIVGSVAVASRNPISKCNPVEVLDITESSLEATVEVFRKYDLVVDCAGPSAILGEPISHAAAIAGVPLVSAGHKKSATCRTHVQVHRCGAIPGALASAFQLANCESGSKIEVVYQFHGPMTVSAARDIIDAPSTTPTDFKQPSFASSNKPNLLTAFVDQDALNLANSQGLSVSLYSLWSSETVVKTLSRAASIGGDRGARLLSAVSHACSDHEKGITIKVASSSKSALIRIPSPARFIGHVVRFAAEQALEGKVPAKVESFNELLTDNELLPRLIKQSGGCIRSGTSTFATTFEEEGEI